VNMAQVYIREIEDVCAVSLRDVSRFIKLWLWFVKSLGSRPAPEFNKNALDEDYDEDEIDLGSAKWGYWKDPSIL